MAGVALTLGTEEVAFFLFLLATDSVAPFLRGFLWLFRCLRGNTGRQNTRTVTKIKIGDRGELDASERIARSVETEADTTGTTRVNLRIEVTHQPTFPNTRANDNAMFVA